jgi:hypothetical protein
MFTFNNSIDSLRTTSACSDFINLFNLNERSISTSFQDAGMMSNDLMDESKASFNCADPFVTPSTPSTNSTTHHQVPQVETKSDILLDPLEPKPIYGIIRRVRHLPLTSFLSDELLKNCNDYCVALQSVTNDEPIDSTVLRTSSNPSFCVGAHSIECPKLGIPRSYSESVIVSSGPPAATGSSDEVHIYDYQQERWMDRYQQLSAFFQEHGHSDVSNEFDSNLAGWVRRQRHQFKRAKQGRRSTLTVSRVHLLEQVGFKWDKHSLAWFENFERLKQFYKIHKHCNVPTSNSFGSKEENDRLLNWCKRQKRAIRMYLTNKDAVGSRMDVQRLELLQSIGFRWQPVKQNNESSKLP